MYVSEIINLLCLIILQDKKTTIILIIKIEIFQNFVSHEMFKHYHLPIAIPIS